MSRSDIWQLMSTHPEWPLQTRQLQVFPQEGTVVVLRQLLSLLYAERISRRTLWIVEKWKSQQKPSSPQIKALRARGMTISTWMNLVINPVKSDQGFTMLPPRTLDPTVEIPRMREAGLTSVDMVFRFLHPMRLPRRRVQNTCSPLFLHTRKEEEAARFSIRKERLPDASLETVPQVCREVALPVALLVFMVLGPAWHDLLREMKSEKICILRWRMWKNTNHCSRMKRMSLVTSL